MAPGAPGSPLNVALVRQVIVEHLEAGGGFQVSETHGAGCNREPNKSGGKERQKPAASAEGKRAGTGRKSPYIETEAFPSTAPARG